MTTVFDPFTGTSNDATLGARGLGFGLYIAREIVRAHGGTIAVSSTKGKGTTFTIRWPRTSEPSKSRETRSMHCDDLRFAAFRSSHVGRADVPTARGVLLTAAP